MTNQLRRVALIGLPAAGKTTVGRLLAGEFRWSFFDCDATFEAEVGRGIGEWVAENGWSGFRERERRIIGNALELDDVVIATGGGVVEEERNRAVLAASSTVVWLDAPPDRLAARLGAAADRPLLAGAAPERLEELAERRNPLYAAIADIHVCVADIAPRDIVAGIIEELDIAK